MANHIFPSTFFGSSGIRPSHDVVKERQYETFEFNNWQRVKWAKLKYNVWSNCLFKHFTLYKHICFRLLLTSYWLLLLSSSRTVSSLAFNYIHWRVSETSLIYPPFVSHVHSFDETLDLTSGACPIALTHVDHLVIRKI